MEILVRVVNQKLKIRTDMRHIVSGTKQFVRFIFDIPDQFAALAPHAQFVQGENIYDVELSSNDWGCYLPWELNTGVCTLSLYGIDGDIIGTTDCVDLQIIKSAIIPDAETIAEV